MEDMLTFVSRKIKSQDSLSMQELIEKMGLTRSMFYRFIKEPWRFSDSDFDKLSEILSLDNEEEIILKSFKNTESSYLDAVKFNENKTDDEKDRINRIIHKLIFEPPIVKPTGRSKAYTLFGSNDDQLSQSQDTILKCSTNDIINRISNNLAKKPSGQEKLFINIYVFNTYSKDKVSLPYELINGIYHIENIMNVYNIHSLQIINKRNMSLVERLEAFNSLQQTCVLQNHVIRLSAINKDGIASLDCCIVEYIDKVGKTKYAFIIFNSTDGALIHEFENKSLFEFLCYECNEYLNFNSTMMPIYNLILFNKNIAEITMNYRRTSITPYLCVEDFTPQVLERAKQSFSNNSEVVRKLRSVCDKDGVFNALSDTQYLNALIDGFKSRHLSNEENESVNLISASGLKNFADTGLTIDTKPFGIVLDNYSIIEVLEYIKSRLGSTFTGKGQRFYIIKPLYYKENFALVNFRNYSIGFGIDFEQTIQPFSGFYEKEMTIVIHDYIHDVVLQKENQKKFNSPIYTDERAAEFIDSLINDVKARMGK